MTFDPEYAGAEPVHTSSQTDHALTELQLYGWRPFQDEPDPRPLPEGNTVAVAVTDTCNLAFGQKFVVIDGEQESLTYGKCCHSCMICLAGHREASFWYRRGSGPGQNPDELHHPDRKFCRPD